MSYEYHKLLKYVYFEGYANSYEEAEQLLEQLSDDELNALLEEKEEKERDPRPRLAHRFPLTDEEEAIVKRLGERIDAREKEEREQRERRRTARQIPGSDQPRRRVTRQNYEVRENYDLYEFVISYLLDEGYADNLKSAEQIANAMGDQWLNEIISFQ